MTRPRLGRTAMDRLHARATAEHAALEEEAAINRIEEVGAIARLATAIHASRSPDRHPRLGELQTRVEALERARRKAYVVPPAMKS